MNLRFDRRRFMTGTAGATLATSVQGLPEARAQAPTRVTVRIDREFTNLDPGFRTGPFEGGVIRTVNQRLMKQKPNSAELELDAASEVKQTSPTTVEFRLKPGQMFTDGFGEMTAEDVKFSFERIGLPPAGGARPSPYRADWASLDRVEVTGQHTGRIVLAQPRANLFDVAIGDVSGCIVSRRAVEARGAEYATKPIGSGPYMFADYERQRGATLKRNPAFSGARPTFEEVVIRSISDPRTTDLA
ncbi:MAG: ABC transporter substrate-binding protein, partial [Alphaproteobacteria bacterium]|nr:ABC transporter substrate-binding protein [Alphaproteobacteria bacterium]